MHAAHNREIGDPVRSPHFSDPSTYWRLTRIPLEDLRFYSSLCGGVVTDSDFCCLPLFDRDILATCKLFTAPRQLRHPQAPILRAARITLKELSYRCAAFLFIQREHFDRCVC
jgi:hypothetical protein